MTMAVPSAFDREFGRIQEELVRMGQMVVDAIGWSMKALEEADTKLAKKVIEDDEPINALRFQIEEDCLALIATKQPAARDLRAVIAASHIVVELERIGDYAAGISKTVVLMRHEPLLKTLKKIFKMGSMSQAMLTDSLQAFIKLDAVWAHEIADMDPEMDRMYKDVFDHLVKIMAKEPEVVARATYLMWTAHNLERIADRVTNIAERTVFVTTGDLSEFK
jgi:phosphate transport system protein